MLVARTSRKRLLGLIFFFWLHHAACGILVPQPGIKPGLPAVRVLSPNHWTTREFLLGLLIKRARLWSRDVGPQY